MKSTEFVQSLEKGLKMISIFNADQQSVTLSEAAELANMTRATARRFLLTLTNLGYISFDGKFFRLTPKVLDLGYAYLASMPFYSIIQPFLTEITKQTQESCSAGVLDGYEVVYVARAPSNRVITISSTVGRRLPAHATSMGRVFLADMSTEEIDLYLANVKLERFTNKSIVSKTKLKQELKQIRRQGYSIVDEELEIGLRTIAIPIKSKLGNTEVGVNIAANSSRISTDDLVNEFLPLLKDLKLTAEHVVGLARP